MRPTDDEQPISYSELVDKRFFLYNFFPPAPKGTTRIPNIKRMTGEVELVSIKLNNKMKCTYRPIISKPFVISNKKQNEKLTEKEKKHFKKLRNRESTLESRRKAKEKILKLGIKKVLIENFTNCYFL